MAKYRIYAGLGSGFGGPSEVDVREFEDYDEAMEYAREQAVEEYQSYEGFHGVFDRDDVRQDLRLSFGEEPSDDDVEMHYWEEVESWITYDVEEVNG